MIYIYKKLEMPKFHLKNIINPKKTNNQFLNKKLLKKYLYLDCIFVFLLLVFYFIVYLFLLYLIPKELNFHYIKRPCINLNLHQLKQH